MKKQQKILILIMVIGIILLVSGGILLVINSSNKEKTNNNNESTDKEETTRPIEYYFKIAKEMYHNNSYLNLPQRPGETGYFMTVGALKNEGYDTTYIDPECGDGMDFIYFDVGNSSNYDAEPIRITSSCIIEDTKKK